ncbi:MAG: divalent-cation tolerance protein CutA [Candidatus Margulisbacteria bacterium]|nr:divalent-cation tolerance protein CutA [Candidatus Margulisiibacteriota bacterium]
MENPYLIILTTFPSKKTSNITAFALLKSKLAACVQIIGPIESHYWWQGKIEKAKEWLCIIKSIKAKFKRVEKMIKANHPYSVPQIMALPITAGSKEYLGWIGQGVDNGQ